MEQDNAQGCLQSRSRRKLKEGESNDTGEATAGRKDTPSGGRGSRTPSVNRTRAGEEVGVPEAPGRGAAGCTVGTPSREPATPRERC